jgi:hypothetical protein
MAKWTLEINSLSLGGFAPAWYKETYPTYGNRNQLGAMTNMDLTNPGYITQGPGLANLTNGTQAGAVTTLIKHILNDPTSSDVTFGIGGNLLHKITSTTVVDDATWPKTIDKAAVTGEDGESVVAFQGNLYYLYNHSGSAGDIGKYNLDATFDDDWGSTVPTGMAALTNNPHPSALGGNDTFAFGNGRYVGVYDGTTLDTQALDLPTGSVVVDIKWNSDRWWVTANHPNVSGSNRNKGSIYIWDGTTTSWEAEIKLSGLAGASHVKNGVLFQFYRDLTSTGGYKLSYVSGNGIVDLCNFTGALPSFYQVTDYKDFIAWDSSGSLFAYGAGDKDLPVRFFQLADSGYSTAGALATPFGTPMVASTESTNYRLAQFSGYDTNASFKTINFDITGEGRSSSIDTVRINFETLAAGARVNVSLKDAQGKTIYSDVISHTKLGAKTTVRWPLNGKVAENFRLEFDYSNGSATNPVSIKSAKIYGNKE